MTSNNETGAETRHETKQKHMAIKTNTQKPGGSALALKMTEDDSR